MLPSWLPNVHPLLVHFPVALLSLAVLLEIILLWAVRDVKARRFALVFYLLSLAATVGTYFSGRQAADAVHLPTSAIPVVSRHADLAFWIVVALSVFVLLRLIFYWRRWDLQRWARGFFLLFMLLIFGLVQRTAEYGGQLVYQHAVGVKNSVVLKERVPLPEAGRANTPLSGVANVSLLPRGNQQPFIILGPDSMLHIGRPQADFKGMWLTEGEFSNLEMHLYFQVVDFTGKIELLFHFRDENNYDFAAIDSSAATIGRWAGGEQKIFSRNSFTWSRQPQVLRLVSHGNHLRLYVNGKLAAHTHASAPEGGRAGLRFSGRGTILVQKIEIQKINNKS